MIDQPQKPTEKLQPRSWTETTKGASKKPSSDKPANSYGQPSIFTVFVPVSALKPGLHSAREPLRAPSLA